MTQNTGWGPMGAPGPGGQGGGWGGVPPWGGWPPPAPQPGAIPLRPLALGDMLRGAFAILRKHWKQLAGVMLAVQAVVLPVMAVVVGIAVAVVHEHVEPVFDPPYGRTPGAEDVVPVVVAGSLVFVLLLVVGMLGMAVLVSLCQAVLKEAVMGRPTTFRAMRRAAVRRAPAVAGAMLLTMVIAGAPVFAVLAVWVPLVVTVASGNGSPALLGVLPVLLLAALPLTVWLTTRLGLAPAAVVLEGAGPVTALRRSAKLVRGDWWRIFGYTVVGGMIAGAVSWLVQMPFNVIGMFAVVPALADQPEGSAPTGGLITALVFALLAMVLGTTVGQMFQIGFTQLVSGIVYVDQRIRREGLADAILAELAAGRPAAGPAARSGGPDGPTAGPDAPTGA
ncbi:hypothetical protein OV450_3161 [Actinobacteria bacterium OV450]|nr:hypothetical protein OV450_3161 [Actinobacteria bacterium OV450]